MVFIQKSKLHNLLKFIYDTLASRLLSSIVKQDNGSTDYKSLSSGQTSLSIWETLLSNEERFSTNGVLSCVDETSEPFALINYIIERASSMDRVPWIHD